MEKGGLAILLYKDKYRSGGATLIDWLVDILNYL